MAQVNASCVAKQRKPIRRQLGTLDNRQVQTTIHHIARHVDLGFAPQNQRGKRPKIRNRTQNYPPYNESDGKASSKPIKSKPDAGAGVALPPRPKAVHRGRYVTEHMSSGWHITLPYTKANLIKVGLGQMTPEKKLRLASPGCNDKCWRDARRKLMGGGNTHWMHTLSAADTKSIGPVLGNSDEGTRADWRVTVIGYTPKATLPTPSSSTPVPARLWRASHVGPVKPSVKAMVSRALQTWMGTCDPGRQRQEGVLR